MFKEITANMSDEQKLKQQKENFQYCLDWIAEDDVCVERAIRRLIEYHKTCISGHKDQGFKENDRDITINREMIEILEQALKKNLEIQRYFL